jgi:predicted nucleotidyltransferase
MNTTINILTSRLVHILSANNPSVYLYGSIVLKDFKPGWSDIDIICLTDTEIGVLQANQLVNLRQELTEETNTEDFRYFEGNILSTNTFIYNKSETVVYWGSRGQKITDNYSLDPFSRMELIDSGQLLYGPDIRASFRYPTKETILEAIVSHYETIRKYAVTTSRSIYSAGWLLDIARCLYTLRTGKIIAKTKAGEWALKEGLVPDAHIMEKVLSLRNNPNKYISDEAVLQWCETLGEYIQNFADVLEKELLINAAKKSRS